MKLHYLTTGKEAQYGMLYTLSYLMLYCMHLYIQYSVCMVVLSGTVYTSGYGLYTVTSIEYTVSCMDSPRKTISSMIMTVLFWSWQIYIPYYDNISTSSMGMISLQALCNILPYTKGPYSTPQRHPWEEIWCPRYVQTWYQDCREDRLNSFMLSCGCVSRPMLACIQ